MNSWTELLQILIEELGITTGGFLEDSHKSGLTFYEKVFSFQSMLGSLNHSERHGD